jgi:hypothetical protein
VHAPEGLIVNKWRQPDDNGTFPGWLGGLAGINFQAFKLGALEPSLLQRFRIPWGLLRKSNLQTDDSRHSRISLGQRLAKTGVFNRPGGLLASIMH